MAEMGKDAGYRKPSNKLSKHERMMKKKEKHERKAEYEKKQRIKKIALANEKKAREKAKEKRRNGSSGNGC